MQSGEETNLQQSNPRTTEETQNGLHFADVVTDELRMRRLQLHDYYKELLSQLSPMQSLAFEKFEEQFAELSNNPEHLIVVVENLTSSKIVASGTLFIERKFIHSAGMAGHIEDVVVDNESRGHNLGKKIIDSLTNVAKNYGCYKVILDCDEKVVGFYEKCNYKRKGVQMASYFT